MRISAVPGDKFTFSFKHSILEMKKIMEKEVIPVNQGMEMKITMNQVQVFEFGFDFDNKIETKVCLNTIHLCPHFEIKLCLHPIQSCPKCFLNDKSTVSIDLIDSNVFWDNVSDLQYGSTCSNPYIF